MHRSRLVTHLERSQRPILQQRPDVLVVIVGILVNVTVPMLSLRSEDDR